MRMMGYKVSKKGVWLTLSAAGLMGTKGRKYQKRHKSFCAEKPDDLWQIDFGLIESERIGFVKGIKGYEVERRTGRGVVLRDGDELIYAFEERGGWELWKCVWMITIVDDRSRYVRCRVVRHNPRTDDVVEYLKEIFEREGRVPCAILTDNGSQFGKEFDRFLRGVYEGRREERMKEGAGKSPWIDDPRFRREKGIIHLRTSIRHPETVGKCERANGYIKMIVADDGREIEERLREAVFIANYLRVSRTTGEVPAEVYGVKADVRRVLDEFNIKIQ